MEQFPENSETLGRLNEEIGELWEKVGELKWLYNKLSQGAQESWYALQGEVECGKDDNRREARDTLKAFLNFLNEEAKKHRGS